MFIVSKLSWYKIEVGTSFIWVPKDLKENILLDLISMKRKFSNKVFESSIPSRNTDGVGQSVDDQRNLKVIELIKKATNLNELDKLNLERTSNTFNER